MVQSLVAIVEELRKKRAGAGLNGLEKRRIEKLEKDKVSADDVIAAIRHESSIGKCLTSGDYDTIRRSVRW